MFCYFFFVLWTFFFSVHISSKIPLLRVQKKKKITRSRVPFFPKKSKNLSFFFFFISNVTSPSQASQIDLSRSRKTNLLVPTISSNKECLTGSLCYINLVLISYKKHQQTPHLGLFKIEFWIRITSQFLSRINFDWNIGWSLPKIKN